MASAKTRARNRKKVATDEARSDASANTGEAILAMMEEIWAMIPDEERAKMPTDLAEEHDHYAYGLPKRKK